MSLAIPVLEVAKILDPRVKINNKRIYAVLKGGTGVTYTQYSASTLSTNSLQFTCNPPNSKTIIVRKVYNRWYPQLSFTGTGTPLLNLGLDDAFRSYPISSSIKSLTATINNASVTTQVNTHIQPYLHLNNPINQQDHDLSMTPTMLDQYQNYSDYVTLGTARSPLSNYGVNSTQVSRGAFPYTSVVNGANSAVISAVITEPLFVAPFTYGSGDQSGFIGVENMSVNISTGYGALGLNYMWSHASTGNVISSMNVTFTKPPQLLFTYISPDPFENIPIQISYSYFTITDYSQPTISLAPGASSIVSFNNVNISSVPNRILLWAREQENDATINSSDVYANISNVNLEFAGRQGIFAQATEQDLYQTSMRNGLNMSWPQWNKYQGSIMVIDPSLDLGLSSDLSDGVGGSQNLQPQMTITNTNTTKTINYTPYLSVISEGVFTIANQQAILSTSVLSRNDVLTAKDSGLDLAVIQRVEKLIGGSFFGDVGKFFKELPGNVYRGVESAIPYVEKAINVGKTVAPFLPLVGLGNDPKGGKMINRKQLLQRNY